MHRAFTGPVFAIAFGCVVSLAAQSPTTAQTPSTTKSHTQELNVIGCVSRAADGAFLLTKARVERGSAAPTTTSGSGTAATAGTTGSTATRSTEPAGSGTAGDTTWALKGGSDLANHVGHTIQVTGRTETPEAPGTSSSMTSAPSTATSAGTTGGSGETRPRALEVQSIKMISTSCS